MQGEDAMNVYDFDNTILRGDSTARFFAYCLLHRPKMWLDIPGQTVNAALFIMKIRSKQVFKERMLHFLARIGDVDQTVADFWERNFERIKPWYFEKHRADDVVISASPEFLIRPACEKLNIRYIMGSPVDKYTGKFSGLNCHGREKVRRFYEAFPGGEIGEFFSDSRSDAPLAELSQTAWLVKGEKLLPWSDSSEYK